MRSLHISGGSILSLYSSWILSLIQNFDADPASQCSGSGIRCLFDPWIRDPGWEKNQDQDPGWTTYFRELRNNFWVKILNSLMRIRDPGWKKFGYGIDIPDPQYWLWIMRFRIRNADLCVQRVFGTPYAYRVLWVHSVSFIYNRLCRCTVLYCYGKQAAYIIFTSPIKKGKHRKKFATLCLFVKTSSIN